MADSGSDPGYEAKEILRDYYARLASCIRDPVQLSKELFQERVISEQTLREIEPDDGQDYSGRKNTMLLRSMRAAITQDHVSLWKFAYLLTRYEETKEIGTKLLNGYEKKFGPGPSMETSISDATDGLDRKLGIRDLAKVEKLLKDFNDWKTLGLNLGIKITTLERIHIDKHNVIPCKREMLSCWLRGDADDFANTESTKLQSYSKLMEAINEIGDQETLDNIRAEIDQQ